MSKFPIVELFFFDATILTSGGDSSGTKAKEPNAYCVGSACVSSTLQVLGSCEHKTG